MRPADTRPYELALLRATFSPESARKIARSGNIKLFGDEATKSFYRAFLRLHFDRMPVTSEAVLLEIRANSTLEDEQCVALVEEVVSLPEPTNVDGLIDGLGKLRSRAMLADLTDYLATPEAVANGLSGAIVKINEFTAGHHMVSAKKAETLSETLARVMERTELAKVWTPGLGELDDVWKIRKGSYGIIGADSGVGKTSMLINMVLSIARQDTHVGVISIEMTADELTFRAAAMEAGVDAARVEDNDLTDFERKQIQHLIVANKHVYDRIHILDPAYVYAEDIPGHYNELITQHGCEVIAIDYAQRIGTRKNTSGKTESVAVVSETITAVTKATGVASIVLSVLNESHSPFADDGKKKRKGLFNLKHSHQLGHDAHYVVILSNADEAGPSDAHKLVIAESVKVRKGRFFSKVLAFHGPTQRFTYYGDVEYN